MAIEAVKLNKSLQTILRDYAEVWLQENSSSTSCNKDVEIDGIGDKDGFADEENDDRCTAICKKSRMRCFLKRYHAKESTGSRHKFTPTGRLSASTIERTLMQLSSGQIKSMAGLDDTDEEKGRSNFQNLRALVKSLGDAVGLKTDGFLKIEEESIIKKIDSVEEFHKVGFPRHLEQCKTIR